MKKRFLSNYLFLHNYGFYKQHILEVDEAKNKIRIFPLEKELEAVSWLSGLIAVIPIEEKEQLKEYVAREFPYNCKNGCSNLAEIDGKLSDFYIKRIYPFDFTAMMPAGDASYLDLRSF